MKSVVDERDRELTQQHNQVQAAKLELSKEIKAKQSKEHHINKNQATLLDKDRMIMELQQKLGAEQRMTDSLRVDIRDLKKYHIEEVQKKDKLCMEKVAQLKELVG